jgi:hypothetical protein
MVKGFGNTRQAHPDLPGLKYDFFRVLFFGRKEPE